jgi:hypothetical protein
LLAKLALESCQRFLGKESRAYTSSLSGCVIDELTERRSVVRSRGWAGRSACAAEVGWFQALDHLVVIWGVHGKRYAPSATILGRRESIEEASAGEDGLSGGEERRKEGWE